jgi:general secretion pathway protein G
MPSRERWRLMYSLSSHSAPHTPRPAMQFRTLVIQFGLTLIELMLSMVVVGILAGIGYVSYSGYTESARIASTISQINSISLALNDYKLDHGEFPDSLSDVDMDTLLDPWGNPYQYLNIATARPGHVRKDHFLVPLNTDYDLYSMGPDGDSKPPLTARASRDDIVRANNGGFVGPATDY